MELRRGTQVGPYEIVALLGAGGMGEVYRARDTRLHREVAIKVLPESLARDQDRLRRFEQEARSVAALNHQNILAIYDIGQYNGAPYLVTELLEGESLRSVLRQEQLSDRKRLDHAVQIAQGLAAAHEKGIVHRDLKPENLFVTTSGRVKILDFGLAKLAEHDGHPGSAATLTRLGTSPGIAVGTPAYMAPEQLRGLPVDHRSDIFSFGLVLCELFSGRHPFQRPTSVEMMNAILNVEPFAEDQSEGRLPEGVRLIASHCLEKDPHHRFQSAQDLAFNLDALSGASRSLTTAGTPRSSWISRWSPRIRLAAEALLVGALVTALFLPRSQESHRPPLNAAILPPPGEGYWADLTQPAALSPDGKFLAIVSMHNGQHQLWLRRMDAQDAQPIRGTERAANPFWSPDSKFVGFFTGDRLKKLDVSGGAVSDVCPVEAFGFGGAWSSRGVIVLAILGHPLRQVPDAGGVPQAIPGVALSSRALSHSWPVFLPDGNRFLYMDWAYPHSAGIENAVWAASLDGERPKPMSLKATNVQYAPGHLLFSSNGDLFSQQFDAARLELSGAPLPLARGIQYDSFFHNAAFTVSDTGVLVYAAAGTGVNSALTWVDRNGKTLGVLGEPAQFLRHAISPDAQRVAVCVKDSVQGERIWIYDVSRGTRLPLATNASGSPYSPIWSPDGRWVAYRRLIDKVSAVKVRASDGSGEERQIGSTSSEVIDLVDWSHDGRYLLFYSWPAWTRGMHDTIQVWPVAGNAEPVLKIDDAWDARLSYDGHWLAYHDVSDDQLYVTSFPRLGARIAIATGGDEPRWRADGQELYYVGNDRTLMAAQVRETAQDFKVISTHSLFRLSLPRNVGFYDVTPDGQRFLINTRTHVEQSAPLTAISDWPALIRTAADR
jgi:eukaryotic-like serine/threonine-protein kinase